MFVINHINHIEIKLTYVDGMIITAWYVWYTYFNHNAGHMRLEII